MNTAINLLIRIFLRFNNTQGMYRGTAACTTNILYKYRVLYELIILTNSFLLFFFFFLFPLSFLFFLPHRERERENINNEVRGCTQLSIRIFLIFPTTWFITSIKEYFLQQERGYFSCVNLG